ncbi:MAG: hypothetical protein EOM40_08720 [Clostridia bacterium]|nr:hypothetical protein [Clostridia bacterium]NCC42423.1 hypothetical protein [Clostridia bacterium]
MSSKTKIVVLHMKEVIYTAIFLVLAILMIALLVLMFGPDKDKETAATQATVSEDARYIAGVYTTAIELNDNNFDVQVTVDSSHINSIKLVNLSETATAMYPLMEPTLENLASQIYSSQSTDHITYEDDNKYTSMLLLEAIKSALSKAALS